MFGVPPSAAGDVQAALQNVDAAVSLRLMIARVLDEFASDIASSVPDIPPSALIILPGPDVNPLPLTNNRISKVPKPPEPPVELVFSAWMS